jgi:glucan phosphoethanolaminetransferase (alkaline phosphatase superfamily)
MYNKFNFLKELPLLRGLIIFIIGIVSGSYVENYKIIILIACIILFTVLILGKTLLRSENLPKKSKQLSILSYTLLFILGVIYLPFNETKHFKKHYSNVAQIHTAQVYKLKIEEVPKEKDKSIQIEASVIQIFRKQ